MFWSVRLSNVTAICRRKRLRYTVKGSLTDFFEEKAKSVFVHGDVVCHFAQRDFPMVVFDDVFVDGLQALFVFMNGYAVECMMADVSAVSGTGCEHEDLQKPMSRCCSL